MPKHCGNLSVAARCTSSKRTGADPKASVPALDVAASLGSDGQALTLAVVNRHPTEAVSARLDIAGGKFSLSDGHELTAASLLASNSVAKPNQDCVQSRRLIPAGAAEEREFPPRSITLLQYRAQP